MSACPGYQGIITYRILSRSRVYDWGAVAPGLSYNAVHCFNTSLSFPLSESLLDIRYDTGLLECDELGYLVGEETWPESLFAQRRLNEFGNGARGELECMMESKEKDKTSTRASRGTLCKKHVRLVGRPIFKSANTRCAVCSLSLSGQNNIRLTYKKHTTMVLTRWTSRVARNTVFSWFGHVRLRGRPTSHKWPTQEQVIYRHSRACE